MRSRFGVTLPAERTAVCGVSASGELALAIGLRHPGVYGAVFCASPEAGYQPPDVMPNALPRTHLTAGTLEPFFLENANRLGSGAGRCGGGCRDDRAGRIARGFVLAGRVPTDGGVGVCSMSR